MHSKLTATLLSILAVSTVLGDEASKSVERLRASYESAMKRATDPIKETYRKELAKLLDQYTRSGKLDDALVVKQELSTLEPAPAPAGVLKESADHKLTKRQLEKALVDGKWLYVAQFASETDPIPTDQVAPFSADGTWREANGTKHGWRVESDGTISLYTESFPGWGIRLTRKNDSEWSLIRTGKNWNPNNFSRFGPAPK